MEEGEGEHRQPGGLEGLLGGLVGLGQGVLGELEEQLGLVEEQEEQEEELVLPGKSAVVAAVGDHYIGAAAADHCSGTGVRGFRCIGSGWFRYTERWERTAGWGPAGASGALSWCDGVLGALLRGSGGPGAVAVAVAEAVAVVEVGTCLGLSDVVGAGDLHVLRTFVPRGAACRTGRSSSSAGIARTSWGDQRGKDQLVEIWKTHPSSSDCRCWPPYSP